MLESEGTPKISSREGTFSGLTMASSVEILRLALSTVSDGSDLDDHVQKRHGCAASTTCGLTKMIGDIAEGYAYYKGL